MPRTIATAVKGLDSVGEFVHAEEDRHSDGDFLRDRPEGIHVIWRRAEPEHDYLPSRANKGNAEVDDPWLADAFEHDVRSARATRLNVAGNVHVRDKERSCAKLPGPFLLHAMEIGDHHLAGAKTPSPKGDGEANRAGPDDQHAVTRS